jgi:hypothetical protein
MRLRGQASRAGKSRTPAAPQLPDFQWSVSKNPLQIEGRSPSQSGDSDDKGCRIGKPGCGGTGGDWILGGE